MSYLSDEYNGISGDDVLWFYGVTLKVPIGPHEAGAAIEAACIAWDAAEVTLHERLTSPAEDDAIKKLGWAKGRELSEDDCHQLQALAPEMTETQYSAYRKANTYPLSVSVLPNIWQ